MTIKVLIADDQEMVRTGFRMIVNANSDMEVVAEAADGVEAVELARRHRPDVSLLDIRMPKQDGLQATRLLAGPGVAEPLKIVVVTTFDLDEYVYGALRAGALGFLLKDAGPTLLIEAIRAAAGGESLVSPAITVRLLKHLARPPAAPAAIPLSERELDVVERVARGRTNNEIAEELFVAVSTVKSHLESVRAKINVRNRTEIAVWAWENKIVG
ncbi:response regulator [Stackebrandtia nassauensis]|uniref:Two component transcriptional regulator, LuxR family n=1 Tax=Stackebrandtia nassauensis (strain DSM 44728 / CIP 108903 / NRRL B-16338 / NBRC 102104 / LLR-40K-21) TaxID=446470 RepID=D3PWV7_STANL|nr:response regulator transcription factor [Stackebrandtia nassauensis]ADD45181.1 two component transcriptional regulator, LuxR family [Stackebrandtia nassauensis DSM 44728]